MYASFLLACEYFTSKLFTWATTHIRDVYSNRLICNTSILLLLNADQAGLAEKQRQLVKLREVPVGI